jgi:RHS repeat-associated protein
VPTACEAEAPGQGRLFRHPDGYRWIWPWGRVLHFDADGWLVRIGPVDGSDAESLHIARDAAGRIVQVTDPAGRRMALEYSASGHLAAVIHPLGTWRYRIDAAGRLRSVAGPDGIVRRYEYDDIAHPSRLTAITTEAAGKAGAAAREIGRWSYDAEGRVAAYRRPDGSELRMTYLRSDAPEEPRTEPAPRTEVAPRTAVSVLTNALGERTRYTAVEIAGRWRVTEIRGPGCAECGPTDVRMRYDARGGLIARWRIDGEGVEYRRDALGRVVQVLAVRGFDRPPRSARLMRRYEYADDESGWPSVIARPSVVPGREHRITVARVARGDPREVIREGFAPPLDAGQQGTALLGSLGISPAIRRTVRFRHETVGGRRLLVALDGPLDNGPSASPSDADVVRFGHDAAGLLAHVSFPGGIERRYLERDAAGRPTLVATDDGHRLVHRRIVRDVVGRMTALEVTAWRLDAQGRVMEASRLQRRAAWRYDAEGRLEEAVDPAGRAIRYDYDAAGRPTGVRDASGHRSVVERDAEGRVRMSALYRPGEATPLRAAYFIRGGTGGIRAVLFPDGRLLRFQRDRTGRAVGLADDAGRLRLAILPQQAGLTAESRDDFGQVVQRVRRAHGASLFRYDDAGRLVERTDAGVERRLYRHDAAGRLLAEETQAPDGTGGWQVIESVRRQYQGSLLVRVEGPVQQTAYRRDALGRIEDTDVRFAGLPGRVLRTATRRDAGSGLVRAELLADGRSLVIDRGEAKDGALPRRLRLRSAFMTTVSERLSRWLPPRLHRALDRRLPAVTLVDGIVVDAFDGLVAYRHGNGIRVERAHDPAGRLVGLRTGTATSDIAHWRFEYGAGRRIRAMEAVGQGGAQLVPVAGSAADAAAVAAEEVDTGGRVVAADGRRYEYGPGGRLATVRDRDGELIARYAYNERGQRVGKSVRASGDGHWMTTFYLWSRDRLVAELDGDGAVAKQHVALDDGGRSLPVALLGRDGSMFAIHVEHRGAPIAMTDAGRRVVWRAEVAPSGIATVVQALGGLTLDLRLPGQHADEETGLHDNWHRTYDPRRGRYLQPDPLGYPDGDDPYSFAGGDPLNRSDPFGLYEIDIHYYMTFFLGVTAGLDPGDARIVALASQYVDDNPLTRPLSGSDLVSAVGSALRNQQQLLNYHFVLSGADGRTLAAWRNDRLDGPDSPQLRNLFAAVEGEGVGHDGGLQFLGEYLHALADTFAHRDADDMPYDALLAKCGIGHGLALHEPDLTYDAVGGPLGGRFWEREARTLAMELRVHDVLRAYGEPGLGRSFAEIEVALREFNAIPERERGRGGADFPRKLARLEAALAALGYGALDLDSEAAYGYSEREAAHNRRVFLRDERTGTPLLEIDFPGTCLEGGTRCRTR